MRDTIQLIRPLKLWRAPTGVGDQELSSGWTLGGLCSPATGPRRHIFSPHQPPPMSGVAQGLGNGIEWMSHPAPRGPEAERFLAAARCGASLSGEEVSIWIVWGRAGVQASAEAPAPPHSLSLSPGAPRHHLPHLWPTRRFPSCYRQTFPNSGSCPGRRRRRKRMTRKRRPL